MSVMKRINEQLLVTTLPASLRRWLRENPESRHLVEPAPAIKGEQVSQSEPSRPQGRTVQLIMF